MPHLKTTLQINKIKMFAKLLMVFAVLLVHTQGEPTPQSSQLSEIFAPRAGMAKLRDIVNRAIYDCRLALSTLRSEGINKIEKETDQFKVSTDKIDAHFYNNVYNMEMKKGNWTIYEYIEKAKDMEQNQNIGKCKSYWYIFADTERILVAKTIYENMYKFFGDQRSIQFQYERELALTRNDLESLDYEAWTCENDECLQIILRKVKVYEGYIKYVLGANISESVKEVVTSSGQVTAKLLKLVQEFPQKLHAVTGLFVKCAEKVLA